MWLVTPAAIAVKKSLIVTPAMIVVFYATLPMMFNDVALFLGPHILAAIGGTIGTAVRFIMLKMPWRHQWQLFVCHHCGGQTLKHTPTNKTT